MVIIADTSPLNYLLLIDEVDILPKLYSHIVIPEAVFAELQRPKAPVSVLEWMFPRVICHRSSAEESVKRSQWLKRIFLMCSF